MILSRLSKRFLVRVPKAVLARSLIICSQKPQILHLQNARFIIITKKFSAFSKSPEYSSIPLMDQVKFESLCSETLETLLEYFEEIVENDPNLENTDVGYSDGVLTIKLGNKHGTYVINRQTPNRQVWLSSPISGPKRYDWIDGNWIYKHDGVKLHQLLQNELESIISIDVDFLKLTH